VSDPGTDVTIVVPTFNREAALRETLPERLAITRVGAVVVVVDGSTDGTLAYLATIDDPRLRVISQPNRGAPAARNAGWAAATTEWVLFTDDDDYVPAGFAEILLTEARRTGAEVISGPTINLIGETGDLDAAIARFLAAATARVPRLGDHQDVVPPVAVETPYLTANCLVRADLRQRATFDEGFTGVAWREETAFFLRCIEAGAKVVLTPATASARRLRYAGGAHEVGGLRYEWSVVRSNWRFLRAWGPQLMDAGEIRSPLGTQMAFTADRAVQVTRGKLRKLVVRP
jgi:glycosyltransferase involved in cell wall biosynthesis